MCRVLIVDDEPQVRDLTSRALFKVNLACDTAGDGFEAIKHFQARRYDAVVTDLRMPHYHGHRLTVDLLNRPEPPSVVIMTGFTEERLVHDLMSRGVQDIFWKPLDYSVLALKLLSLVDKNKHEQATGPLATRGQASPKLTRVEESLMEVTGIFADSLAGVFAFNSEVADPPKAVTDFIARFAKIEAEAAESHGRMHDDRRASERVACSESVTAVPVTRQFVPAGPPFRAAIRDVSEGGIRLLHTRATNAEYLALNWRAETLPYANIGVVAQVTRCEPISPFYDISGEFVLAD